MFWFRCFGFVMWVIDASASGLCTPRFSFALNVSYVLCPELHEALFCLGVFFYFFLSLFFLSEVLRLVRLYLAVFLFWWGLVVVTF